MSERAPQSNEQVSRLLIEKRCEVYSKVASLLMDLDEALTDDDGQRARYLLRDIRRCLRSALAFLTADVYQELERVEVLEEALPQREGATIPAEAAEDLSDRLQLLHVKLARALQLPHLQDMEQIVGLPARLRQRLAEESRDLDLRARRREIDEQCWRFESEAREHIGRKHYHKAVKSLRKAIRLDGERAVFHNDLGVVLSLLGRNEEAVESYRQAVTLNERHTDRRTDEWTTSYYNLGIALRKASIEALERGDLGRAVARLRESRSAFEEYTRLNVTGAKVQEARGVIGQLDEQIGQLEAATEGPAEA